MSSNYRKHLPYLATHPGFDRTKPTIIYFHGWLESGSLDLSVLAIRGAYMDRGDHNVVTVGKLLTFIETYLKNFFP